MNPFQFETKQNLNKFEGSSGISSADLFGTGDNSRSKSSSYYGSGPDFQDIKDGVKQGVSKVAGRLSNIASGVMSSLQVGTGGVYFKKRYKYSKCLLIAGMCIEYVYCSTYTVYLESLTVSMMFTISEILRQNKCGLCKLNVHLICFCFHCSSLKTI